MGKVIAPAPPSPRGMSSQRYDRYPFITQKPLPWYFDQTRLTMAVVVAVSVLIFLGVAFG